ncbi:MAG: glycosyltransferase family 4 protein [Solirubrobacteraceae bacterium]
MSELDAADAEGVVRVAVDVTHAEINRTGLGRYAAELRPALEARPGVRVAAIAASDRVARSSAQRLLLGVRREALYYPFALARRARRAGASVLHLPTPAAALGGGLPLVVTVHDLLPLRHPRLFTAETRLHTRLFAPFVRRAERVIVPSEATRGDTIELLRIAPERVVVVPMARGECFRPGEVDREALRAELGIRAPYLLAVGTLEPRKNLVTMLRAFSLLAPELEQLELVIAGGRGWRNEAFERELTGVARDRVRLTGFVSEQRLVDLYRGCACFAFPSLAEGFGLPPLEALACGAPVVVSDRPALPEVVGDAALLADPRDPEAVAAQVRRILDDEELAARLRAAGPRRAAAFTWAATAAATEGVYRDAIADRRVSVRGRPTLLATV